MKEKVIEQIVASLPRGRVCAEGTARELFMSRSTMQRKLKQEETTFKELLDEIRKKMALSYLEQNLSITQITYLLGLSSPSVFGHSFKRWFGVSPGKMK